MHPSRRSHDVLTPELVVTCSGCVTATYHQSHESDCSHHGLQSLPGGASTRSLQQDKEQFKQCSTKGSGPVMMTGEEFHVIFNRASKRETRTSTHGLQHTPTHVIVFLFQTDPSSGTVTVADEAHGSEAREGTRGTRRGGWEWSPGRARVGRADLSAWTRDDPRGPVDDSFIWTPGDPVCMAYIH